MSTSHRSPAGGLLRILGLAFGLAVVVGGVVGQGIFRAPGLVAGAVPHPGTMLLLWMLGGILVLIDACAMVELSASVQRAGGPYVFTSRALGRVVGTVTGWADFLLWIMVTAFLSVVFGEYVQRLGIGSGLPIGILSTALIAACWAVNWTGTKVSGASQTLFSAIKGVVLIVLIAALMLYRGSAPTAAAAPSAIPASVGVAGLLVAMRAVLNTYGGWWSSSYFNEEIVDADRNLARATFGGIITVGVLYVAVNAAMLHVLSPAEMAASELPAADAAARVFGPASGSLMTGLAIFSVVALTNLVLMLVSRIGYGMARDGVLPAALASVAPGGTPRIALSIAAAAAALLAASGTYETLIAVTVPLTVAMIAAVDLAAIMLRLHEPDLPRPFKMPLFPLPAVIGLMLNLTLLVAMLIGDFKHAATGIGAAVVLGLGYALWGEKGRTAT
ncbi:MAG: APC family permease [Sphingomicrobium sp.]